MSVTTKTCTMCLADKEVSEFGKHNQTKDGLKSRCKLCHAVESRASRGAHIEKARTRELAYHHAHRAERNAKSRAFHKKHGRPRPESRETANARLREWKANNPGKVNADTAKRRAAKLQATPEWADMTAIKALYVEASLAGRVVDHIVPLRSPTVCGLHVLWNLQPLTALENARKGNRYEAHV